MRRYMVLIICVCLCEMCLHGCGMSLGNGENMAESSGAGDYLSILQDSYNPIEEAEDAEELFPVPSEIWSEFYITNLENNIIGGNTMIYSGELMEFKLITSIVQRKEDGPQQFNRVFFILVDGYLQPFYFEDSREPVFYASISAEASSELSDYVFSFEPVYVPYGEKAVISFVIASAPIYYQEKASEMVYSDIQSRNYCLTAQSEKCAVDYEKVELPADAKTDYTVAGSESNGIFALTEKLERADQLNINTLLDADEQLYVSTIGAEILGDAGKNIRLYCVVDGGLAPVFGNHYYTDLCVESMKPYQIPLDMDKLTLKEKQQIYFVKVDMGTIEDFEDIGEEGIIPEPLDGGSDFIYCVTTKDSSK